MAVPGSASPLVLGRVRLGSWNTGAMASHVFQCVAICVSAVSKEGTDDWSPAAPGSAWPEPKLSTATT
jgi:hypothetical protein